MVSRKHLLDTITILAAVVLGSLVSLMGYWMHNQTTSVERLMSAYAPVVEDMRVVGIKRTSKEIYIHVVGTKRRDCGPLLAVSGVFGRDGQLESVVFMKDFIDGGKYARPEVRQATDTEQDFGWWRLKPLPTADPVVISVFHNCPGAGLVRTQIGPFFIL